MAKDSFSRCTRLMTLYHGCCRRGLLSTRIVQLELEDDVGGVGVGIGDYSRPDGYGPAAYQR